MKLNVELSPIDTNINRDDLKFFTIKNNTKMFNILSDGLYSDKISAIIRELSCNAWDSHVAAGKQDVQFHIHLPNHLDPEFRIRDFGVGLSKDDVNKIFTVYGESTKTESQDFTGALGLGSKSPFSYVESYTVTSWFNGKKNVYSALRDETGLPAIMHIHEEDSTEDNGVEISFPAYSRDFESFKSKASEILRVFPLTPKITGNTIFISKYSSILSGTNWKIYENANFRSAIAIMANVRYPIAFQSLKTNDQVVNAICNLPIEIVFDNGELDFAASREQLSYTQFTINAILTKLEEIKKEISEYFEKEFSSCKTLWEAKAKWDELLNGYSSKYSRILNAFIKASNLEVKWKGLVISSNEVKAPYKDVTKICDVYAVQSKKSPIRCSGFDIKKDGKKINRARGTGVLEAKKTDNTSDLVYINPEYIKAYATISNKIAITQKTSGCLRAFHKMRQVFEFKYVTLLFVIDKKSDINVAIKKLSKLFGDMPIENISQKIANYQAVNKPVKKPVTGEGFILSYTNKYLRYSPTYNERAWTKEEIDTSKDFGFVELNRFEPVRQQTMFAKTAAWLDLLYSQYKDVKNIKLYGIRKSEVTRLTKAGKKLQSFEEAIIPVIEDFASKYPNEVARFIQIDKFKQIQGEYNNTFSVLRHSEDVLLKHLPKNHAVRKLLESDASSWFKNANDAAPIVDAFNNLAKMTKILDKIKVKNTINDLKTMLNDVKTKYNMLHYISAATVGYNSQNFKNDVINYINQVDKSEE